MKRWLKLTLAAVLVFSTLLVPSRAHADVAPPKYPPGSNPQPGSEVTQVRMMAETVLIDVQANAPSDSLGKARVSADFTMHNLGSQTEVMNVGFPISSNDGSFEYPEITNVDVKVNSITVITHRTSGSGLRYSDDTVPWAEFEATFPPGQDVSIQISYTLDGTGEYPYVAYYYILATGAGWKDNIGSADIILRLPYEANPQNLILDTQIGWSQTTPGGVFSGNEMRWHYENLEPTIGNNIEISLVMPSAWKKVLTELDNIGLNPDDGEAWGRLGKIYKEITLLRRALRQDAGGQELYHLSIQAYEKAVTLLPEDALWHAGFAELLYLHYYWDIRFVNPGDNADMLHALEELNRSIELDPNNVKARSLLDDISYALPEAVSKDNDRYLLLWLTATPTPAQVIPTETPTLTATAAPSATPIPTRMAGETPAPTANPKQPFCSSALLIPVGIGLVISHWHKRRKIFSK